MITSEIVPDLGCPTCHGEQLLANVARVEGQQILSGNLTCRGCGVDYDVSSGVANLVPREIESSSDWQVWHEHLAGFEARRQYRQDHPNQFSSKITNASSPLQKAFAEFVGIEEGTVLDIGCGPGNFRKHLKGNISYYGVDPLPVDETKDFPAVRAVAEYLPFRDDLFTDVIVMAALDHFQDVEAFCKEVIRVLKPGGRMHIVQAIHDVRGPITAVKFVAHETKDFLETRQTKAESRDAPKHMGEFSRKELYAILGQWFRITAEDQYSKRWYSPENLFLTMTPLEK